MLLVQTDALWAHLGPALARLPDDLRAAVDEHVNAPDGEEGGETSPATIPHKVLVSIGKWARGQSGTDRGEGSSFRRGETCPSSGRGSG